MTINIDYILRKMMGWCPDESITERKTRFVEYEIKSKNAGLPVKKWKLDLLIIGHICALLFASLFILPMSVYQAFDLYNSPYLALNHGQFSADITSSVASTLFSIATVMLIYNITVFKKLYSKLCYFNIILLSGLFVAIILQLSFYGDYRLEWSIYWAFVLALFPSIPSILSIWFNKRYGEQKLVEGSGLVELIKQTMGWCPQKTDFSAVKDVYNIDYAHNDNRKSNYYPVKNMDVPIQMLDWRIFSIALILGISGFILIFVDLFNGFPGIILVYMIFILLIISIDRIKISIDPEKVQILKPFLKPVNIPKHNINCIKIIDNSIYKHRWMNIVLIIFIMLFVFLQALTLYRKMIRSTPLEEMVFSFVMPIFLIFLLILSFQRNIRRSHYPKAIKIETTNNITLYPRNESEFNILKEELEK